MLKSIKEWLRVNWPLIVIPAVFVAYWLVFFAVYVAKYGFPHYPT